MHRIFFWFFGVLFAFPVACLAPYDPLAENGDRSYGWSQEGLKVLNCNEFVDCQPYEPCVSGGYVVCDRGHCTGVENERVDIQCLIDVYEEYAFAPPDSTQPATVPSSSVSCGVASPPSEQVQRAADRTSCGFFGGTLSSDTDFRPWMQAVADVPGGTVKVVSFTIYGVTASGYLVPVAGTAAGGGGITWVGTYHRVPWYVPTDQVEVISVRSDQTYSVPTGSTLLHLGNDGGNAIGYREGYAVATVQTSGDVRVQIGIDYYAGFNRSHEGAVSDWVSCPGGSFTFSTPLSTSPLNCGGATSNVCVPNTETCNSLDDDCDGSVDENGVCASPSSVPVSGTCPADGVQIVVDTALTSVCASGVEIVTWGAGGGEIASAVNAPLTLSQSMTQGWSGFLYVTTRCSGTYRADWPSLPATARQAGYAKICSHGIDVTALTPVCSTGNGLKISVALDPAEAGRCQ